MVEFGTEKDLDAKSGAIEIVARIVPARAQ